MSSLVQKMRYNFGMLHTVEGFGLLKTRYVSTLNDKGDVFMYSISQSEILFTNSFVIQLFIK